MEICDADEEHTRRKEIRHRRDERTNERDRQYSQYDSNEHE